MRALHRIDDVNILVTGKSAEANCKTLVKVHDIAKRWARLHASVFNLGKYKLMHFTNYPKKYSTTATASLRLSNHQVEPSQTCKLLGLHLDPCLSWEPHIKHIQSKIGSRFGALASIAASSWGLTTLDIRRLYIATIIPIILYGCSAWYFSGTKRGTKLREQKTIKTMSALQRCGAQIVAGAFCTTAGAELDIEMHLLPMKQQMEKAIGHALLRIISHPMYPEITALRDHTCVNKRWASPLYRLMTRYKAQLRLPKGNPETREPYVVLPW